MKTQNIAIVTAYNDMLSAHKTYEDYPQKIRNFALKYNAVAQVAGGVDGKSYTGHDCRIRDASLSDDSKRVA
jgi:dihydroxyacid dehydratase/phosphogluconate dehydratase